MLLTELSGCPKDSLCLQSEAKHASDGAIWVPIGQSLFAARS